MNKVIYLPFENLPQRYTKMWNDSFIQQMSDTDIVVWGKDVGNSVINTGEFLDTYATIAYKMSQMKNVALLFQKGVIKDGDVFFVPDVFYPGLSAIRYMSELSNINVRIVAFNHAGRADKDDFVQRLDAWSDTQEKAWHEMCDTVLVGSEYHKERVQKKFNYANVTVTGAVWSKEWLDDFCANSKNNLAKWKGEKEDYIIWPHRPCDEKQFDLFLEIARQNPALRFVITSGGKNRLQDVSLPANVEYLFGLSKEEYYYVFALAKGYLSTALQETFGYTLQEAIYFNCKVVVPDYACYREYANKNSIVTFSQMIEKNFLTGLYDTELLRSNIQFPDNAGLIYNICKNS